jgi:hypothetical protein
VATCRDCDGYVIWADRDGNNVPFNPWNPGTGAKKIGLKFYVIINGKARRSTNEDERLLRDLYLCHFDICSERH